MTSVDAPTALVLTVNEALVAPAATVTLEGPLVTAILLLERVIGAPPAGAGPLSVTVPVENIPGIVKAIPGLGENRSPSRRNHCSPSARNPVHLHDARNRFHVHPGILFALPRNPHPGRPSGWGRRRSPIAT